MDNLAIAKVLKTFTLFKSIRETEMLDIASSIEEEVFPANFTIMNQGDVGDKIYFIISGRLQAYVLNKQGEEVVLTEMQDGAYFGELALLGTGLRACFIRTLTPTKLMSLTKKKFDTLLDEYPSISAGLNVILTKRLSETLNLVSKNENNQIILLNYSEDAIDQVNEFIRYFESICPKSIQIIPADFSMNNIEQEVKRFSNHYILIKNKNENIKSLDLKETIINFDKTQAGHFSVPTNASPWKTGHIARCILKKTIGIALCSGGAPAVAHMGVLRALQAAEIPLDYIVGSSAGALFGACFAFNLSYEDVIKNIIDSTQKSLVKTILLNFSRNFTGLIQSNYYKKIFAKVAGEKLIEDALIPFAAVASDLLSGETVVIKSGKLVDGLLASNAAPVIIEPIHFNQQLLIDGVATSPMPMHVLIEEKMDIKIAVPIPQLNLAMRLKENPKVLAVYLRSRAMMAEEMLKNSISLADVIIEPNVAGIHMLDWKNFENTIVKGEEAANVAVKRIKNLLSSQRIS